MSVNKEIKDLMKQALEEGILTCPECYNNIETDAVKCVCNWINPLTKLGFI